MFIPPDTWTLSLGAFSLVLKTLLSATNLLDQKKNRFRKILIGDSVRAMFRSFCSLVWLSQRPICIKTRVQCSCSLLHRIRSLIEPGSRFTKSNAYRSPAYTPVSRDIAVASFVKPRRKLNTSICSRCSYSSNLLISADGLS